MGRRSPTTCPTRRRSRGSRRRRRRSSARRRRWRPRRPSPGRGPGASGSRRCSRSALRLDDPRAGGVETANGTRALIQGNDFSIIATTAAGPKPPRDTYTVRFKTELQGITAFRLEALTFEELPKGGPGRDPEGGFVVSEMEVRDADGTAPSALRQRHRLDPVERPLVRPRRGRRRRHGRGRLGACGGRRREPPPGRGDGRAGGRGAETTLTLVLHQNAGASGPWAASASPATTRHSARPHRPRASDVSEEHQCDRAHSPAERTPQQQDERSPPCTSRSVPWLASAACGLSGGRARAGPTCGATVPSSFVTVAEEPEPVRILPRGNWLDESGEVVDARRPRISCRPLDTGRPPRDPARPRALAHLRARTRSPPASS